MGLTKKHCHCYRHQKNAWVDVIIFKDWFQNHFVPMAKEKLIELSVELEVG